MGLKFCLQLVVTAVLLLGMIILEPGLVAAGPTGPTSWWRAEGNANDSIDGNHGALVGATFAPGKVGQAFSFDGLDDFVSVPDTATLYPGAGSFSIDAWFQTTSSTGIEYIVSRYECGGVCISFVSASLYQLAVSEGKLYAWIRDSASTAQGLDGNKFVADGNFHHAALVRDTGTNTLLIYLDGALENNTPLTVTGTIKDDDGSPDPLIIGATTYPDVQGGGERHFFSGLIDEVQYFDRALTASEIAQKVAPPTAVTLSAFEAASAVPGSAPAAIFGGIAAAVGGLALLGRYTRRARPNWAKDRQPRG